MYMKLPFKVRTVQARHCSRRLMLKKTPPFGGIGDRLAPKNPCGARWVAIIPKGSPFTQFLLATAHLSQTPVGSSTAFDATTTVSNARGENIRSQSRKPYSHRRLIRLIHSGSVTTLITCKEDRLSPWIQVATTCTSW